MPRQINTWLRGFALAPLLYIIALAGIAGAVLFTGYTQILRSNVEITADNAVRNQIRAASETLAARALIQGSPANLLPPSVVAWNGLDAARIPRNSAGTAAVTQSEAEGGAAGVTAGGVPTTGGVRAFDPWGRHFIMCRWVSPQSPGSDRAMALISAGADGRLQSTCNSTTAQGDDRMELMSVANVLSRSATWQTMADNTYRFGVTGDPSAARVEVGIDDGSRDLTKSLDIGGPARFRDTLQVDGAMTTNGTVNMASMTASGNITGGSLTSNGTLNVTGATTLAGLTAGTTSLGGTTAATLGVTGATTLASTTIGTVGTPAPLTVNGNLTAGTTSLGATTTTSLSTGAITASGLITANGNLRTTNIDSAGTTVNVNDNLDVNGDLEATSAVFTNLSATNMTVTNPIVGSITGNAGSANNVPGTGITGIVPLTAGGTGVNASSNANLRTLLSIQTYDDDLQALADATTTGFIRRSGAGAVSIGPIMQNEVPAFSGATVGAAGSQGGVPAPVAGQHNLFLRGDGTWATVTASGNQITQGDSGVSVIDAGTGAIIFNVDGVEQGRVTSTASADRTFRLTGGTVAGDVPPTLSSFAAAGNVPLRLATQGTGNLIFSTNGVDRLTINGSTGVAAGSFSGPLAGNASTATALQTARDFSITGDATASAVSFNGTANVALNATVTRLQGRNVASTAPNTNEFLGWSGSAWTPLTIGASLDGTTIGSTLGVRILAQNGSAAAPAYSFASDQNTGIYRSSEDAISFATNGILRGDIGNDGGLRMYSGIIESRSDSMAPVMASTSFSNTHAPHFIFTRARGSFAAPASVNVGEILGIVRGQAHSATWPRGAADIRFEATEAAASPGTRITFHTTPNTTGSITERLRITEDGLLNITNGALDTINYGRAIQITNANGNRQQIAFIRNGFNVLSAGYNGASGVWGFGPGQATDSSFAPSYLAIDMANSGNVGIGTVSPGAFRLNVNGDTNITGNLTVSGTVTGTSGTGAAGANTQVQFNNSGVLGGSANFVWNTGSNLLDVNGTIQTSTVRARTSSAGLVLATQSSSAGAGSVYFSAPNGNTLEVAPGGATTTDWVRTFPGTAGGAPVIDVPNSSGLNIGGAAGGGHIRILGGGNVGVGVSPTGGARLQVHGPSVYATQQPQFAISDSGGNMRLNVGLGTDGSNNVGWFQVTETGVSNNRNLALQPFAGNVGIGTTVPGYKLSVAGDAAASWVNAAIGIADTGASGRVYSLGSRNGVGFHIGDETAGASRLVINSTGNVGIGTASPSSRLDVVGTITVPWGQAHIQTDGGSSWGANRYNTVLATGWDASTDDFVRLMAVGGDPTPNIPGIWVSQSQGLIYSSNNSGGLPQAQRFRVTPTGAATIGGSGNDGQLLVVRAGGNSMFNVLTSNGSDAIVSVISAAGNNRLIRFQSPTAARWDMGVDGVAESGSNAGSNFFINRFNDAGTYIDTPFAINRATGNATFATNVVINGNLTVNGTCTGCGGGGGTPAGSNTQIQFNNSGAFGASANLTFNTGTNTLGVGGAIQSTGTLAVNTAGNRVDISSDGAIEIFRSGGAAYIDLRDNMGDDFDVRMQMNGTRLSLSGGIDVADIVATGNGSFGNTLIMRGSDPYIRRDVNNSHMVLSGGSGWTPTSATIALYGISHATSPGNILFSGADSAVRSATFANLNVQMNNALNVNGIISGNGKQIFNTADTYLRINETAAFSAGTWFGGTNVLIGGGGGFGVGSNGGTTNSRVWISSGSFDGNNVINLNGANGGIFAAGNLTIGSTSNTMSGTGFRSKIVSADSRVIAFEGAGAAGAASVWWGNATGAQFAIDSINGGGAQFWTNNNGAGWGLQMQLTHGGELWKYGNGGFIFSGNNAPTIHFADSDHRSAMIHVNSNLFYILRGCGTGSTTWCATGNGWPLEINLENNDARFAGNITTPQISDLNNTGYFWNGDGDSRMYWLSLGDANANSAVLDVDAGGNYPAFFRQNGAHSQGVVLELQTGGGGSQLPPRLFFHRAGAKAWTIGIDADNSFGIYEDGASSGAGSRRMRLNGNGLYVDVGFLRTYGNTGWYNETYGGGWFMQDSTWLRSWGKSTWLDSGWYGTNGGITLGYSGGTNGSYQIYGNGNILMAGYFLTSDAREKHDIQPFERSGLDVVGALRAVHFKWNKNNKQDFGVIAQEVEKVLPEAVITDVKGMKAVEYPKLVLPVIEAIKELHVMVKDLTVKVAALFDFKAQAEKELAALKAENAQLKQELDALKGDMLQRLQKLEAGQAKPAAGQE